MRERVEVFVSYTRKKKRFFNSFLKRKLWKRLFFSHVIVTQQQEAFLAASIKENRQFDDLDDLQRTYWFWELENSLFDDSSTLSTESEERLPDRPAAGLKRQT